MNRLLINKTDNITFVAPCLEFSRPQSCGTSFDRSRTRTHLDSQRKASCLTGLSLNPWCHSWPKELCLELRLLTVNSCTRYYPKDHFGGFPLVMYPSRIVNYIVFPFWKIDKETLLLVPVCQWTEYSWKDILKNAFPSCLPNQSEFESHNMK